MTAMQAADVLVAFCALVGAVLSVFNFLKAREADRVRLLVTPASAFSVGFGENGEEQYLTSSEKYLRNDVPPDSIAISVVNLSKFPVTVSDAGFTKRNGRRASIYDPIRKAGLEWPARLEPRNSITLYVRSDEVLGIDSFDLLEAVYVVTECGTTTKGTSGMFEEMKKALAGAAQQAA